MSKVVEVKQQVGKASGKPYWNVKLDDGTYANSFSPVNVGQEGTVTETTKGDRTYKNFAPIAQASGQVQLTPGTVKAIEEIRDITYNPKAQLDRIEQKLDELIKNWTPEPSDKEQDDQPY